MDNSCFRTVMVVSCGLFLIIILLLNVYVGNYDNNALGDLATWVGSYLSFATLITSIIIAIFAYKITHQQNIIAERTYMLELLKGLAEKIDKSLIEHDNQEKDFQSKTDFVQPNIKFISVFVTTICKAEQVIDISVKNNNNFYKNILKSYLDTDVDIELSKEKRLKWLKDHNANSESIEDIRIQYRWARKFLEIKLDK